MMSQFWTYTLADGRRVLVLAGARLVREFGDKARQLRPRGVRASTMRALSRAVAARDGSGFYGPQP